MRVKFIPLRNKEISPAFFYFYYHFYFLSSQKWGEGLQEIADSKKELSKASRDTPLLLRCRTVIKIRQNDRKANTYLHDAQ